LYRLALDQDNTFAEALNTVLARSGDALIRTEFHDKILVESLKTMHATHLPMLNKMDKYGTHAVISTFVDLNRLYSSGLRAVIIDFADKNDLLYQDFWRIEPYTYPCATTIDWHRANQGILFADVTLEEKNGVNSKPMTANGQAI